MVWRNVFFSTNSNFKIFIVSSLLEKILTINSEKILFFFRFFLLYSLKGKAALKKVLHQIKVRNISFFFHVQFFSSMNNFDLKFPTIFFMSFLARDESSASSLLLNVSPAGYVFVLLYVRCAFKYRFWFLKLSCETWSDTL